ncbi:MAG: EAL domain-containing protein [Mycobacteriales bacterium]|nr:EAL domain-containing protein [Mycobacteriales bacterium]
MILLVEDDPDHAFLIRRQLAEHDLGRRELVHLTTAAAAALRLAAGDVACVILDLSLPDAKGMEGLNVLRAVDPAVPIVVLTGLDSETVGLNALKMGAQDYLVKGQHATDSLGRSVMFAMERARRQQSERTQLQLGTRLAVREAQLSEAQRLARLGSWEWDLVSGYVAWSQELLRLTGLPEAQGEAAFEAYLGLVLAHERRSVARLFTPAEAGQTPIVVRHRIDPVNGPTRWVLGHMTAAAWDDGGLVTRILGTMQDITEQKTAEDRLAHQALHDGLTGLVNRGVLLDRLTRVLSRSRGDASLVAVIFLDLDQFKWINDSHSHLAGDHLLIEVARRLEQAVRPSDTLARFGGDEFVVLCERLQVESEVLELAERMGAILAEPFVLSGGSPTGGEVVTVTASMGVATAQPGSGAVAELLVRDADIAMYRAKELGRSRFEIFDEAMRERATSRLRTQKDLSRALKANELEVHFQPVVDMATGQMTGSEALVRWQHPERGLLLPDSFIPVAEESGLIVALGAFVLERACQVTAMWNATRQTPLTVAVNLSARQLNHPDLVAVVGAALRRTGLPSELLGLEVTETVVMEDPQASGRLLQELRSLGVSVAIDDFGTGYSSLAYLHALPLDQLKVDRSFVQAMSENGVGMAITSAIVALAKGLDLSVLAEGVETVEQRDLLIHLGVTSAQGWLWGRAVPAHECGWAQQPPLSVQLEGAATAVPQARKPAAPVSNGAS